MGNRILKATFWRNLALLCIFLSGPDAVTDLRTVTSTVQQAADVVAPLQTRAIPGGALTSEFRDWVPLREGLLKFVAELKVLYPTEELYFLARDQEYSYLLAKFLSEQDPEFASRLHLLNVSSKSKTSPLLRNYLEQQGFSSAQLQGKRVVLVESGFLGTVPESIKKAFPELEITSKMIVSRNPALPSTRVFLNSALPLESGKNWKAIPTDAKLVQLQELPHQNTSAAGYRIEEDGRVSVLSRGPQRDELRIASQALYSDIRNFGAQSSTRTKFSTLVKIFREAKDCFYDFVNCGELQRTEIQRRLDGEGAGHFFHDLLETAELPPSKPVPELLASWKAWLGPDPLTKRSDVTHGLRRYAWRLQLIAINSYESFQAIRSSKCVLSGLRDLLSH